MSAPKPMEEYEGDDCWIMVFDPKYEDTIWNYYSKSIYWLKHKNDAYFLLIKDYGDGLTEEKVADFLASEKPKKKKKKKLVLKIVLERKD